MSRTPMLALDHLLWAAPNLEEGARQFESMTGVSPAAGGSHPGFGTRNELVSLGRGVYLEIISPDPDQSLHDNRGGRIAARPYPGLMTFALRGTGLHEVRRSAENAGLSIEGPIPMNRTRPDGVKLEWSILYLRHLALGEAVPFVIDWGRSPHPSATTPSGCALTSFVALQPDPVALREIYAGLGIPVEVKRSSRAGFMAILDTPRGEVVLLS